MSHAFLRSNFPTQAIFTNPIKPRHVPIESNGTEKSGRKNNMIFQRVPRGKGRIRMPMEMSSSRDIPSQMAIRLDLPASR